MSGRIIEGFGNQRGQVLPRAVVPSECPVGLLRVLVTPFCLKVEQSGFGFSLKMPDCDQCF